MLLNTQKEEKTMGKSIDIEKYLDKSVLKPLLKDKTTKKNIIFATDSYYSAYFSSEITEEYMLKEYVRLFTRANKKAEEKNDRTKKKAEVFTPSWLCNKMNNYLDFEWFEREFVFNSEMENSWEVNTEKIQFPKGKTWKDYVLSTCLEIACGEAPYLVSRYDAVTGEGIPVENRIGILDRKLRVVNENTDNIKTWMQWTYRAFESVYGYEYQGDSLMIARINMLETFIEYMWYRWHEKPTKASLERITDIICKNIWQMDGLNGIVPYSGEINKKKTPRQISMTQIYKSFDKETEMNEILNETVDCLIYNWKSKKYVKFNSIKESNDMKFDFVIGNPPYQEDTKGAGRQAKPIYNLFFEEAKKMNPESISIITPSRWFSGGMGLNKFREDMMNERSIKVIYDYTNAKDCFPDNSISGGVNYFVWKKDYKGDCKFINTTNGITTELMRPLNEFPILVRYNQAIIIIHKIRDKSKNSISDIASGLMPFGLSTSYRGRKVKSENHNLVLHASNSITYISENEIDKGHEYLDKYKVLISKTSAEHAGEPGKDGKFKVIPSSLKVIGPGEVCTHSYFLIGMTYDIEVADNIYKYMKSRLVRFLMLMSISGFGLSKNVLLFVPLQDFTPSSDIDWSQSIQDIDRQLYKKYNLTDEEIDFIETNVKEME